MSFQQSENRSSRSASALTALVLGLALCPFIYVLYSALLLFLFLTPGFCLVALPLLLTSSSYLLFRFIGKPKEPSSSGLIAEILSWFVIAVVTTIIAKSIPIVFGDTFDRIALFSIVFLLASLICFPVVLTRKTALQQRLMKLPNIVITLLSVLIVSVSAAIIVSYLLGQYPFGDWIRGFIIFTANIPFFSTLGSTELEIISVSPIFVLLASLLCLPVVLLLKPGLQQRLMKLPNIAITLLFMLFALLVSVSTAIAAAYLLTTNPIWRY